MSFFCFVVVGRMVECCLELINGRNVYSFISIEKSIPCVENKKE